MRATHQTTISEPLAVRREKSKIWSYFRQKWLEETPEEIVRQEYLCCLVNHYGYAVAQIDEDVFLPGERGNKHARADFVIPGKFRPHLKEILRQAQAGEI